MNNFVETVLERNNIMGINSIYYRNMLARIAVYFTFMLEGIYMGVWGRYLSKIQSDLGLSDSLLGTSVLFVYLGTVGVSPLVAVLLRWFASKITTIIGQWGFIISLPLIALANSFGLLTFVMFTYGFTMGIMDISMNNSAILTEIVACKPLLGSFHGSYSVAAALGSLLGGLLIGFDLPTIMAFLGLAVVAFAGSILTTVHFYDSVQEKFLVKFQEERSKTMGIVDCKGDYEPINFQTVQEEEEITAAAINNPMRKKKSETEYDGFIVNHLSSPNQMHNNHHNLDHDQQVIDDDIALRATITEFISADRLFTHNPRDTEQLHRHLLGTSALPSSQTPTASSPGSSSDAPLLQKKDDYDESQFSFEGLYRARKHIAYFSGVGFLAAFGESSLVTWSSSYFERYIDSSSSLIQSLGLMSFMICMALGRFFCDSLRQTIGRRVIIRVGGLFAVSGLVLVVLSVDLPVPVVFACAGFALTGLGLSTLIPTVFSSAGHLPDVHAGTAIATVAAFSYSGSIISSPLIGYLSDAFGSLRYAILFDGLLIGLIFPLSWGILEESKVFQSNTAKQPPLSQQPAASTTSV